MATKQTLGLGIRDTKSLSSISKYNNIYVSRLIKNVGATAVFISGFIFAQMFINLVDSIVPEGKNNVIAYTISLAIISMILILISTSISTLDAIQEEKNKIQYGEA